MKRPQDRNGVDLVGRKQPLHGSEQHASTHNLNPRPQARVGTLLFSLLIAVLVMAVGGCGTDTTAAPVRQGASSVTPAHRSVAVVTTGCGNAPAAVGSGVQIDDNRILTAAHVIAGADTVAVIPASNLPVDRSWPAFSPAKLFDRSTTATVVAVDPALDLAVIRADPAESNSLLEVQAVATPEIGVAPADATVVIHGIADPDPTPGTVAERTTIVADEVRGGDRVRRDGYRLDAVTGRGDSGAGVWSEDGQLLGVVFAVSSDDGSRTWAVSGGEIERFLAGADASSPLSFKCDESTSRLVAEP